MIMRRWALFCLMGMLLVLVGCDLEGLVKKKVPEPLKNLLTFGSPGRQQTQTGQVQFTPADVDIVSPLSKAVYPEDQPVEFRAIVRLPAVPGQPRPSLTWMLFSDKDKRGLNLGAADVTRKKLEAANYNVELTAVYQGQKAVKRVDFRAALMMRGTVTEAKGTGLPQVEVVLTDLEETKLISKSQTAKDGSFSIEFPAEGSFLMTVQKQGYCFSPLKKIVKYNREPVKLGFVGFPAEVKNIRLTATQDSGESEQSVCPLQEAYLKFDLTSELKPVRVEACLFRIEKGQERRVQLDEVPQERAAEGNLVATSDSMRVQVPAMLAVGAGTGTYRLVVTLTDDKNHSFSAEAKDPVAYDISACFRKTLDQAVALHRKSKLEEALKLYKIMDELDKRVDNAGPFVPYMEKAHFNRGLAYLGTALAMKAEDVTQLSVLDRALRDFNSILKRSKNDLEALLLRGLVKQLSGATKDAVTDYNAVISADPQMAAAYDLKAQAYLKTQTERGLARAVDDFTRAINLDPADTTLRKSRRETLKVLVKVENERKEREAKEAREKQKQKETDDKKASPDKKEASDRKEAKKREDPSGGKTPKDEKIDISQVPLRDISSWLTLEKYVRN